MAKGLAASALFLVAALCFFSFVSSADANRYLFVEGNVYCDHCRVEFQTSLSKPIEGASVTLECRSRENGTLSFMVEAKTDADGKYSIPVEGEHEEDICEIKLVNSSNPDCTENFKNFGYGNARVLISKNAGVVDPIRYASPLGFMTNKADPQCLDVLKEMGFIPGLF